MKFLRDPVWGFIGVVVAVLSLIAAILIGFNPQNLMRSSASSQGSISTSLPTQAVYAPTVDATQTATSKLAANNPYPSYLSGNGTLAFVDSLTDAYIWNPPGYDDTPVGGKCRFTGGSDHVSQQTKDYFMKCPANGTFYNFAFEVLMTITQGDCGGMVFRDD